MACQAFQRRARGGEQARPRQLRVTHLREALDVRAERGIGLPKRFCTRGTAVTLLREMIKSADALHPGLSPGPEAVGIPGAQVGEVAADMRPAIGGPDAVEPLIAFPAVAGQVAARRHVARVVRVVLPAGRVQSEHPTRHGAGACGIEHKEDGVVGRKHPEPPAMFGLIAELQPARLIGMPMRGGAQMKEEGVIEGPE